MHKKIIRFIQNFFQRLIYSRKLILYLIPFFLLYYLDNLIGFEIIDVIKYYGLFLQLIGYLLLIIAIDKILKRLYGYGIWKLFKKWLSNIFGKKKEKAKTGFSIEASSKESRGGEIDLDIPPKENFKEVIEYFQNKIKVLSQKMDKINSSHLKKIEKIKQKFHLQISTLEGKVDKNKENIVEFSTPNIELEVYLIYIMIFGTICTTIPGCISDFLFWIKY